METQSEFNLLRQRDNALFRFVLALIATPFFLYWATRANAAYDSFIPGALLILAWVAVTAYLGLQWRAACRKEGTHAEL